MWPLPFRPTSYTPDVRLHRDFPGRPPGILFLSRGLAQLTGRSLQSLQRIPSCRLAPRKPRSLPRPEQRLELLIVRTESLLMWRPLPARMAQRMPVEVDQVRPLPQDAQLLRDQLEF